MKTMADGKKGIHTRKIALDPEVIYARVLALQHINLNLILKSY